MLKPLFHDHVVLIRQLTGEEIEDSMALSSAPHDAPRLASGTEKRSTRMRLTVSRSHGHTIIGVEGQLDAANIADFADVLTRFLRVRDGLIVDLDALQFCSVAGLEFFIYFDRRCRGARCPWALVAGPSLLRLVRLSGVVLPAVRWREDAAAMLVAARAQRPTLRIAT